MNMASPFLSEAVLLPSYQSGAQVSSFHLPVVERFSDGIWKGAFLCSQRVAPAGLTAACLSSEPLLCVLSKGAGPWGSVPLHLGRNLPCSTAIFTFLMRSLSFHYDFLKKFYLFI